MPVDTRPALPGEIFGRSVMPVAECLLADCLAESRGICSVNDK